MREARNDEISQIQLEKSFEQSAQKYFFLYKKKSYVELSHSRTVKEYPTFVVLGTWQN